MTATLERLTCPYCTQWLRGFGWDNERIAARLNVTVSCIEKRQAREAHT